MKRREFLQSISNSDDRVQSDLTPYTKPLSIHEAYHLLRRISFAPTPELANSLVGKSVVELFDDIFVETQALPTAPDKKWINIPNEDPLKAGNPALRFEIEAEIKNNYYQFVDWWINLMRNEIKLPLREKLVLFWSTVWTIEFTYDTEALIPPGLCYRNNQILRQYALGNYGDFAEAVTLDGAMLLYQSLFYSNRRIANENYMRELMELFMMGTGDILTGNPNYYESDVKEGAKALTGWRNGAYLNEPAPKGYFNTYFSPHDHIIEAKSFLNNIIPSRTEDQNTEDQVRNEEVRKIIDIILKERKMSVARFISDKIYKYFVYAEPKSASTYIINSLAEIFSDSDFNLRQLFKSLFTSSHFFDKENIGIQFKTPPDYIIGFEIMLGVKYPNSRKAIFDLEQELYDPPNVGSWKGYRTWISTKTFPLRIKYANEILSVATEQNLLNLAKKFSDYTNLDSLNFNLIQFFLPDITKIDIERQNRYKDILANGISESNWSQAIQDSDPKVVEGIRNLIKSFILSPDFQLC